MAMKDVLRLSAARVPNKTALILDEKSLTYAQLNQRVNQLASAMLKMDLKHGDRVAVLVHNCIEYFEIYMALCKIGGVMVPINNLLKMNELQRDLSYIAPRFIFFAEEFSSKVDKLKEEIDSLEKSICIGDASLPDHHRYEALFEGQSDAEPDIAVNDDDLMSIFLTSGTTGNPKGAMRTHRHNYLNALSGSIEMSLQPDDRVLLLFPFYHVTLEDRLCHFLRGNTIVLRREGNFDPQDVLSLLSRHRITICQFVPTMINTLLQGDHIEQYDLSALRLALYAASPMPVNLLKQALKRMDCGFMQFFGQTETGPMTTVLRPAEHLDNSEIGIQRLASCGRPAALFEARLVDDYDQEIPVGQVGELVVRGEPMTVGYWQLPEETDKLIKGGWLHTGDYARLDEEGFIYIVDRKNDMIISGGKNIYPREVEEVLYGHPAVLEATVIGVPDDHWGEAVKAVVALKPDVAATAEELIAYCKENMASYKKPKTIEFMNDLPKSPTGKILKRVLRDEFWKDRDRMV
ncbi:acyl-CoA synthetase [Desulfosarcina ovata subsp. sediminis]|uniref:Acyl-CoA synthetase n=1 Tax=Desulfosarcina ovata subsp. sediminis TaxID=885957 RepID=A0A5K7ZG91_9BACT|nr:long-chain-fatty-acid--CoA ligase [Desulfosarcina ovata]BBO81208.1 acyl-CoA synthetase [Desulfosarcina ovata subsp. sediminis]